MSDIIVVRATEQVRRNVPAGSIGRVNAWEWRRKPMIIRVSFDTFSIWEHTSRFQEVSALEQLAECADVE